jgi:archaellum component FlaC
MGLATLAQVLIRKVASLKDRSLSTILNDINKLKNSCPNPSELVKVITTRNQIIDSLNSIKTTLNIISSITTPLDIILPPLTQAITLIKLAPIPSSIPPGIGLPVGVITTVGDALSDIKDLFKTLTNQLNSFDSILDYITSTIDEILSQLSLLDILINKCKNELQQSNPVAISTLSSLSSADPELLDQIQKIKDSKQNVLDVTYKGFTFEVIEDPNNTLSIPKRYAVAKNSQGIVLLKTNSSFTNNPNILIEELKFLIDKNSLNAN